MQKSINCTFASDATLLLSESSEVSIFHNYTVCISININTILRMINMQLKNAHIMGHVKNTNQLLLTLFVNITPL